MKYTIYYTCNVVSRLRKGDPPPARQRKVSRIADFAYFIIFLIGLPLADFLSLGGGCFSPFVCFSASFHFVLAHF